MIQNITKTALFLMLLGLHGGRAQASMPGEPQGTRSPETNPELIIEFNTAHLRKGWPLVLSIGLFQPRAVTTEEQVRSAGAFVINPPREGWEEHLSIEILFRQNRKNEQTHLPLQKISIRPRQLTLSSDKSSLLLRYVLPPEETAKLATGKYFVNAKLDTTRVATGGWTGTLNTSQVLSVEEPSLDQPANEGCPRALANSDYFDAIGNPEKALTVLNEYLPAAQPGTAATCLNRRAMLAEASGDLKLAREYYCKASADSWVNLLAMEKSRKKGEQAPFYARSIFSTNCERLTDVTGRTQ
ncbi:hypothetical protein [Myxococcus xanthus]|uniref:hypothetical protein n=1 Tax=Myxococcus xanthus TaxID=34 RepID=UPI00112EE02E|nr:hypothetical protein [Myxococcus xanthus]